MAVHAFLDLMFEERGHSPMKGSRADCDAIRNGWFQYLMPAVSLGDVASLLTSRRFVILQGPPGTGKTRARTGNPAKRIRGFWA